VKILARTVFDWKNLSENPVLIACTEACARAHPARNTRDLERRNPMYRAVGVSAVVLVLAGYLSALAGLFL
jgi:hypothetical protein